MVYFPWMRVWLSRAVVLFSELENDFILVASMFLFFAAWNVGAHREGERGCP